MADVLKDQDTKDIVSSHSMALFRRGIGYIESGKYSEALVCFAQVYKTDEQISNLHYACAVAFMKLGRKSEAVLACQSELTINPDHRDAIALLNGIMPQLKLGWPENTYLVNHDHHFVYCPIFRSLSSNMTKAILKIAGLHEKHGHTEGNFDCEVHKNIHMCSRKECRFKTNVGQTLKILNDDRYFKFTIVRNPWSRLVSSHLSKVANVENYKNAPHHIRIQQIKSENYLSPLTPSFDTFRQFAEHEVHKRDMEINDHWRPQVCFIGNNKFDFIAKFENIQNDLNYINNRLGLNFDINFDYKNSVCYTKDAAHQSRFFSDSYDEELLAIKKSCGGFPDYKQFYPPELKELVGRRYACDIEAFGYEF